MKESIGTHPRKETIVDNMLYTMGLLHRDQATDEMASNRFTGSFSESINGDEVRFQTFNSLKQLTELPVFRLFTKFKKTPKFINIRNSVRGSTHTESGLEVHFFTNQAIVTSLKKPETVVTKRYTKLFKTTALDIHSISLQMVSSSVFNSMVSIPETKSGYVSSKRLDKALRVPSFDLKVVYGTDPGITRGYPGSKFIRIQGRVHLQGNESQQVIHRLSVPFRGIVQSSAGLVPSKGDLLQVPKGVQMKEDFYSLDTTVDPKSGPNPLLAKLSSLYSQWSLPYQRVGDKDDHKHHQVVSLIPRKEKDWSMFGMDFIVAPEVEQQVEESKSHPRTSRASEALEPGDGFIIPKTVVHSIRMKNRGFRDV
jgi:hypothetical protein